MEFIRRNKEVLWGLTAPQLESIGLMALGACCCALIAAVEVGAPGGGSPGGSGARARHPAEAACRAHGLRAKFRPSEPP